MRIERYAFADTEAIADFTAVVGSVETNTQIADIVGLRPFYIVFDQYDSAIEIRETKDGLSLASDYDPVFFPNEIEQYLKQLPDVDDINDELTHAELLEKLEDVQKRLAAVEDRLKQLEGVAK
ncbi:hypothetical protein [Aeromonas phage L9-6]|nr:hypothetical protein [Aeromonas phage L9-6]